MGACWEKIEKILLIVLGCYFLFFSESELGRRILISSAMRHALRLLGVVACGAVPGLRPPGHVHAAPVSRSKRAESISRTTSEELLGAPPRPRRRKGGYQKVPQSVALIADEDDPNIVVRQQLVTA